ncbi:MAG: hypothetical protein WC622_16500 [Pedobacter sp.]|jgi:hypothetical protein|uniref:hypothetical protein n=1 Tax=Pedobacter sp. TaxID=1411316 RepID=UPI00356234B9
MKTKILIILCVVVITACKKKETENVPKVEQKTFISKQVYTIGTYTWNYDTNNQLSTIVFASANEASNGSSTYIINSVNSKGAIVDALEDRVSPTLIDYRYVNTYNSEGNLVRTNFFNNATGASAGYTTLEYLSNNQIKQTSFNASNEANQTAIYTLSTDGKNVIEQRSYTSAGVLNHTYVYSNFDTKKTASSLYPKGYATSPFSENNFQSQSLILGTAGVPTNVTYTYEYNSEGYRTKRTSSSGVFDTVEYIKK